MEEYMDQLRERSKRKVLRLMNNGEVDFENGLFINLETGQPVEGIKMKGGVDELEDNWDDFDDEDDDDDFGDEDDDLDEDDGEERKEDEKPAKSNLKSGKGAKEEKKVSI
eukprot:CAMPEP_0114586342 /NCGR_PEP_ID=MMETSP0125-20121206/9597_1 /TAXON_ID=485358 ORGANISM="Aristerostoma sp., Strain ATCC 50986" /NCGR_SAMPLE_ID=MMETSP0125 /ASSEMBLY_ACC=CAM_ASM_000245 /LENGTH=109 /DNA_ID=CAMNT_0001781747 /DNA_START=408 /DNA_END=737 /DNA_ORIENTATION=-